MIKSFRNKGLEKFFKTGSIADIQPGDKKKLRLQLTALDTAQIIEDMNIPGFGLHSLKGKRQDFWAIAVSGNWRLTFQFEDGNVYLVNYEDYH